MRMKMKGRAKLAKSIDNGAFNFGDGLLPMGAMDKMLPEKPFAGMADYPAGYQGIDKNIKGGLKYRRDTGGLY